MSIHSTTPSNRRLCRFNMYREIDTQNDKNCFFLFHRWYAIYFHTFNLGMPEEVERETCVTYQCLKCSELKQKTFVGSYEIEHGKAVRIKSYQPPLCYPPS